MTKSNIIKIRDVYRNAKIPYIIICDNGMSFIDGIDGSVILWSDDLEVFTCIRSNPEASQAFKPIEITCTEFEHVQFIRACVGDAMIVKTMLDTLDFEKSQAVYEHVCKQHYMYAKFTGSTGDANMTIPSYAEQMKANNQNQSNSSTGSGSGEIDENEEESVVPETNPKDPTPEPEDDPIPDINDGGDDLENLTPQEPEIEEIEPVPPETGEEEN